MQAMDSQRKKIFISHNSGWEFIYDFAGLIYELGYYPIVVENEPDLGLDPNEKSIHYMNLSEMVIFVITRDSVDSKGNPHPKSNVALEIGLAEARFKPEQKIFWVEKDARPPSMVTTTYISVQDGNYYKAIAHLIRNIRIAIPIVRNEEAKIPDELDEYEKFLIRKLSENTHGDLARPDAFKLLSKNFGIDEKKFNLIRYSLKKKRIITEGEIAIGHEFHGDLYLMLTSLGWELASKL